MIKPIVDEVWVQLKCQLDDKRGSLNVSDEARDWLAINGYDVKMGARPMARLIQEKLKKPLAEEVLFGDLSVSGGAVDVVVEDDDLCIQVEVLA